MNDDTLIINTKPTVLIKSAGYNSKTRKQALTLNDAVTIFLIGSVVSIGGLLVAKYMDLALNMMGV